jgi:hypothetical protein
MGRHMPSNIGNFNCFLSQNLPLEWVVSIPEGNFLNCIFMAENEFLIVFIVLYISHFAVLFFSIICVCVVVTHVKS